MALQELTGALIEIPFFPSTLHSVSLMTGGNESNAMNSSGDKNAFIVVAPKAGTLQQVHVLFPTVTTGDDIRFSFQDLSATLGDPDGTADQYRVRTVSTGDAGNRIASGIMSHNGTDGGVKRTVTKGQKFAVVVEFDSYVAGNMVLATGARSETAWIGYPGVKEDTGSGWSEFLNINYPNIVIEYDDGIESFVHCFPVNSYGSISLGQNSTPDEIGAKFSLPFDCKVIGLATQGYDPGDIQLQIENAGASVLAGPMAFHFEPDDGSTTSKFTAFFNTEVTLLKNTTYYVVWKTISATAGTFRWVDVSSGHLAAWPGGTGWTYNERTNGGAWSESSTKKLIFGLLVSSFDDGSGGAGCVCDFGALGNGTRVVPLAGA